MEINKLTSNKKKKKKTYHSIYHLIQKMKMKTTIKTIPLKKNVKKKDCLYYGRTNQLHFKIHQKRQKINTITHGASLVAVLTAKICHE